MREAELPVTFQPSGRAVFVLPGTRLMEAAVSAGLIVDSPCGGEGICGKCRVRAISGGSPPTPAEERTFSARELQEGWRLACQSTIETPARIEIPDASLLTARHQQICVAGDAESREFSPTADPPIRKSYVELPPPSRGSDEPDLLRLEKAIGPFEADLHLARELPHILRKQQFRGTAVLCERQAGASSPPVHPSLLIDFEPGNTENTLFTVALDIGTTTLAAQLLDISNRETGAMPTLVVGMSESPEDPQHAHDKRGHGTQHGTEMAVASRLNPQTRYGDDVLSRILFARENPEGLRNLHETIVEAANEMIGELCQIAGIRRERIYDISCAGNTTMQHLLCGINPRSLGEVPFVPTVARGMSLAAAELGLRIHPRGRAYLFPVIGGFVGGDTTAGIIASGMIDTEGPTLLVDIGTNGEIALWANGRLAAASTAAGPAFEGARISCGMRGSTGAIEKVVADGHLRINVIGNVAPVGLCGSGLIDAAAELLRHGVLNPQGRLLDRDSFLESLGATAGLSNSASSMAGQPGDSGTPILSPLPSPLSPLIEDLARRIIAEDGKTSFLLAAAEESGTGRPIALTQRDFRELQLATGAIRAGIVILLKRAGLKPNDLQNVYLAGGFGNFIRRSNAQRIGLLPHEIEHRRIRFVGNTSLAGARLAALSIHSRRQAEQFARQTEHVDLALDAAFQTAFADAMIFPEE
ncbi:MAG: DUF4445 domain-containing protein [Pirellulales bacterium]|nr:DUF4445 domain-containing protein [Pirellulales bacterium]